MEISDGLKQELLSVGQKISDEGFAAGAASVPASGPTEEEIQARVDAAVKLGVQAEDERIAAALKVLLQDEESSLEAKVSAIVSPT